MAATLTPLANVSELTVEWLSTALNDKSIKSFSAQRIGTGQVSFCYRVKLEGGSSSHPTVIIKMASSDPQSRGSGLGLGLYEKETKWCSEVAPLLDAASLAPSYYSRFADGNFSILMQDAIGAAVGDELVGASHEQAVVAVTEIAKIHAQLTPEKLQHTAPWLVRAQQHLSREMFGALYVRFRETFESRLEPEHITICDRLLAGWESYTTGQTSLVQGLVHGDFRLDNLLFGKDSVTIVDWQTVTTGPAMTDLAYFMGCSLHIEERRQYQDELIKLYVSTAGKEITLQEAYKGVRHQSFFGVFMCVVSSMLVERTTRGDEMFLTMLQRHCAQVLDLDALSLLTDSSNKTQPWVEPAPEDEDRHKPGIEYLWNESWYFDVVDEKQQIGLYIRLGMYPNQNSTWYTAVICGPNIPTVSVLDYHAPLPDENLVLRGDRFRATQTVLSPLKTYQVTLSATGRSYETDIAMEEESQAPLVPVEIDLTWTTVCKPYKWNMTTRYEIPCLTSGSVKVGDKHYELQDCVGQRDHSWGVRDWWGLDWFWSAVHLSDGNHIHAVSLRFPKMANVNIGYVQDEDSARHIADIKTEDTMTKNGLLDTTNMSIFVEGRSVIKLDAQPMGHGAILLKSFDGRKSWFSRAWVQLKLDDGRTGIGWFEFNDALGD